MIRYGQRLRTGGVRVVTRDVFRRQRDAFMRVTVAEFDHQRGIAEGEFVSDGKAPFRRTAPRRGKTRYLRRILFRDDANGRGCEKPHVGDRELDLLSGRIERRAALDHIFRQRHAHRPRVISVFDVQEGIFEVWRFADLIDALREK